MTAMPFVRLFIGSLAIVAAVGCPLDLSVPDDIVIRCDDNADCPSPLVCATRITTCVDAARLDDPPLSITGFAVTTPRLSGVAPFATGDVVVTLSSPPSTFEVTFGSTVLSCLDEQADGDGVQRRCPYTLPEAAVDGVVAVGVRASDALGNVVTVADAVTIDTRAPLLLTDSVTTSYSVAADNPRVLDGVVAARVGTTVEVGFAFDEPCATIPVAALRPIGSDAGDADLELAIRDGVSVPGLLFFMQRTVTAGDGDGAYDVVVNCTDDVGNVSEARFGAGLVIDQTPPAVAPTEAAVELDDGDDSDAVVLVRTPWGVGGDGFASVRGRLVDEAEDARRVDVYAPTLVGTGAVDSDGRFAIQLLVADVRTADLVVVDGAGNVSARAAVKNVALNATLGGKVVGSTFENPHTLQITPELATDLDDTLLLEVDGRATTAVDGNALTTSAALRWIEQSRGTTSRLTRRQSAAVAFDPARGEVVVAAGAMNPPIDTTVQLFDGERWRTAEPLPERLNGGALGAFDTRRDVFVVVTAAGRLFERGRGGWLEREALPVGAVPARFAGLAYDPIAGATIWSGLLGDTSATCAWDGVAWRVLDAGGPLTEQRDLAFDDSLGGIVAMAVDDTPSPTETWLLEGDRWTVLAPSFAPAPAPGDSVAVTADVVGGGLLVLLQRVGRAAEVWRFVDGAWTPLVVDDTNGPDPFSADSHWVQNSATGDVLLFDGRPRSAIGSLVPIVAQHLLFDGARWHPQRTFAPMAPVAGGVMADDGDGGVAYYGGTLNFGAVALNDAVFSFAGGDWVTHDDGGPSGSDGVKPSPIDTVGLARLGNVVVTVDAGVTWFWSPQTATWSRRATRFTPTTDGALHTTLDEAHTLLVGAGPGGDQSFTFDGTSWQLLCDPARGDRCPVVAGARRNVMALAAVRDGVVAFVDSQTDTTMLLQDGVWDVVDGTPAFSADVAMARHRDRQTAVVYAGVDTWELACPAPCTASSARWHRLPISRGPQPRDTHSLASFGDDAVLLAGDSSSGDVWALPTGNEIVPAAVARFSLVAAGVTGTIRGLRVDADVTASGPGGLGAQVRVWQLGRFVDVTAGGSEPGTPLALSWQTTSPTEIAATAFGPLAEVVVALSPPTGGIVDGEATALAIDALGLRVDYRLAD